MKRTFLLFVILLQTATHLLAQKEMSIRDDSIPSNYTSKKADTNEGEIIIRSPYNLTFESVTKEKENPAKPYNIAKEGESNLYYFIFSSLPKYKDRVLKIKCSGYKTISIPLTVESYRIKGYYVWDRKGTIGVSAMDKSINEGMELYELGQYDQAKDKFLDALEFMEMSNGNPEDQKNIAVMLEKTAQCVDAKESADDLFNNQEWLSAKEKYEEVLLVNPKDKISLQRKISCQDRYENTPRIIKGTVKKDGSLISGAVVMAVEYNKKGKEKKPNEATRATTNSSGEFEIKVLNKTKHFKCWEGMSRVKTVKITGDVMHITL